MNKENTSIDSRIDYLDLLKGCAILWIVWYHQPHPAFVDHYYHVPIFFFVSGIFFKQKKFASHLKGILTHIVVPFVFFYLVSYCFQFARYYFENHTLIGFEWDQVLDLFRQENHLDHLRVNRPLWFLVSLAEIQLLYYFVGRLPQIVILIFSVAILLTKEYLLSWQTYLLLNRSIYWLSYYAFGDILGKKIAGLDYSAGKRVSSNRFRSITSNRLIAFFSLIAIYTAARLLLYNISKPYLCSILYEIEVLSFVLLSVVAFSCIKGNSNVGKILRFYGKNSLIVLGLHIPVTIVYGGILFRMFGITGDNWIGFAIFILVSITLVPIIFILKRYLPVCVGSHKLSDNYGKIQQ